MASFKAFNSNKKVNSNKFTLAYLMVTCSQTKTTFDSHYLRTMAAQFLFHIHRLVGVLSLELVVEPGQGLNEDVHTLVAELVATR